ncbi:MAG: hypothetical protein IJ975_04220, partial [Clostridia bacterium]|nr:hypothetical protein [Clostridia bacterium]
MNYEAYPRLKKWKILASPLLFLLTCLTEENIRAIVDLAAVSLASRLSEYRINVKLSDGAKEFIARSAYD